MAQPPEMKSVFSSHINTVGYADGVLYVEYSTGKTAAYIDVPEDVAADVMSSPSIGSAVRDQSRGAYGFKYV